MKTAKPAAAHASQARRQPFAAQFHLCGRVALEDCLLLQQRLAYDALTRNDGRLTVLLCEHPLALTIGRLGSRAQARFDGRELAARGAAVHFLPRGEGAFWHAPGQLTFYAVLHLPWRRWTLGDYLGRLSRALQEVCGDFGVAARRAAEENSPDQTPGPGIWCSAGKLAAVAVALRDGVTSFGGVLNVDCPLADQQRITPCLWEAGGPQSGVLAVLGTGAAPRFTSLTAAQALAAPALPTADSARAAAALPVTMQAVQERLLLRLSEQLGCMQPHLAQGHPQLPEAEEIARRAVA